MNKRDYIDRIAIARDTALKIFYWTSGQVLLMGLFIYLNFQEFPSKDFLQAVIFLLFLVSVEQNVLNFITFERVTRFVSEDNYTKPKQEVNK